MSANNVEKVVGEVKEVVEEVKKSGAFSKIAGSFKVPPKKFEFVEIYCFSGFSVQLLLT